MAAVVLDERQPARTPQLEYHRPGDPEKAGRLGLVNLVSPAGLEPLEREMFDVGAVQAVVLVPDRLPQDAGGNELADGARGHTEDLAASAPLTPRAGRPSSASMTADSSPGGISRGLSGRSARHPPA